MKTWDVAILDDGVCKDAVTCPLSTYRVSEGQVQPCGSNDVSATSHGSICAQIITRRLRDIRLISVSIYRENKHGNAEDLETALRWCAGKGFALINVSCGFNAYYNNEGILEACYRLWRENTPVFAALSNIGLYTVPSDFPCTVGVSIRGVRNPFSWPDRYACGWVWRKTDPEFQTARRCTSFACAQASRRCIQHIISGARPFSGRLSLAIPDFAQLRDVVLTDTQGLRMEYLSFPWQQLDRKPDRYFLLLPFTERRMPSLKALGRLRPLPYCLICCVRRIPWRLHLWCRIHNVRYWDETMISLRTSASGYSVPVIAVRGADHTLHTAIKMMRMFNHDEYTVLLTSVSEQCYLYGAWQVRKESEIAGLEDAVQPDLVIADVANRDWLPTADLSIFPSVSGQIELQWETQTSSFPCADQEMYRFLLQLLNASRS